MEINDSPEISPSRNERHWAMGCHLIGLCALIPVLPPIAGVIGVLVLWLLRREEGSFVDRQGKEALNFQISLFIYASIVLFLFTAGLSVLMVFAVVCIIIAVVKASEGKAFRYPACIRFIK